MASSKKRPRSETAEDARAECPYTIRLVDPKEKEQKKKKRRRTGDDGDDDTTKKIFPQLSPFAPSGKFKTHETMDVHYQVDPASKWSEMTRYNSFVLNGTKYFSEGFIYVANETSIESQKGGSTKEPGLQQKKKSDDDWVARILEIRARDEHHVYARVYWMYWPDELPVGTHDGKKSINGRQPYHGKSELIASNHMDIINVVSVTSQATVNQWFEENDDDVQSALYWRQALDVRTLELSTVDALCKCDEPGNPDKILIGCTAPNCSKWLHEECIIDDALMRTFERLGTDKPHIKEPIKGEEDGGEAKRPLSPTEPAAAVSAQHSIDVKANGTGDVVKMDDNVDVKADGKEASETPKPTAEEAQSSAATAKRSGRKGGRSRKSGAADGPAGSHSKSKPYQGLFTVKLHTTPDSPPTLEFHDLREGVQGGEKTWTERVSCLVCGSPVN